MSPASSVVPEPQFSRPGAAVSIVTWNSERYISSCLDHVFAQTLPPQQVIVVDNASQDSTRDLLSRYSDRIELILNSENRGFSAAHNQAIARTQAAWVLVLNPDVRLEPNFVSHLVAVGELDSSIGSLCGKLLAMTPELRTPDRPVFDSTGMYLTPSLRHFDRGSRAPDQGQYDDLEYVFGGTGAACLYRRAMIDDVSVFDEFFDPDFFAYREDADLAWRAQLLGWKCLYSPFAVGYHVRSVTPENRRAVSADVNMHSVKNRWLLRIKNTTGNLFRRHWTSVVGRDILVTGGCLLGEFSSLRAFPLTVKLLPRMFAKRREIMRRRRVSDEYLAAWIGYQPVSFPAADVAARLARTGEVASR